MCFKMVLSSSPDHRQRECARYHVAEILEMMEIGSTTPWTIWQAPLLQIDVTKGDPHLSSGHVHCCLHFDQISTDFLPKALPSSLSSFLSSSLEHCILFLPNPVAFHLPLQELVPARVAKVLFVLFLHLRPFWAVFSLFSWHTAQRSQMKGQILRAHCFSLTKASTVPSLLHIPAPHRTGTTPVPWNVCKGLALHLLPLLRDLQPFPFL